MLWCRGGGIINDYVEKFRSKLIRDRKAIISGVVKIICCQVMLNFSISLSTDVHGS